jgi:capsular exopolysaccharide synthesis family protein
VIIVCCDLRRPRIHEFFGLDNDTGFTSVLLGKVPVSAALQKVPGQARLFVMASGPLPPNPSELLSSKRTIEVLTSLQAEADIVLIDSPPVLPVTDALVISGRVDATILVCVSGATTRKDAARAVELLDQVDAPLVGTVLNGVSAANTYGYGGQYYRYQSDDQPEASPPAPPGRSERKRRRSQPEQQPAEQA